MSSGYDDEVSREPSGRRYSTIEPEEEISVLETAEPRRYAKVQPPKGEFSVLETGEPGVSIARPPSASNSRNSSTATANNTPAIVDPRNRPASHGLRNSGNTAVRSRPSATGRHGLRTKSPPKPPFNTEAAPRRRTSFTEQEINLPNTQVEPPVTPAGHARSNSTATSSAQTDNSSTGATGGQQQGDYRTKHAANTGVSALTMATEIPPPTTPILYAHATEAAKPEIETTAVPVGDPADSGKKDTNSGDSSKGKDTNNSAPKGNNYMMIGIGIAFVVVAAVVGVVVATVVAGGGDSSSEDTTTISPVSDPDTEGTCAVVVNQDAGRCRTLLATTQVKCDCYNFCDTDLVGCFALNQNQGTSVECSGQFVAGCTRSMESFIEDDDEPTSPSTATTSPPTTTTTESPATATTETSSPATPDEPQESEFALSYPELAEWESVIPSSTMQALGNSASAQAMAYEWLVGHPELDTLSSDRKLQLFALVTLYYATQSWDFDARMDWLKTTVHECDWTQTTGGQVADCTEDGLYQKLVLENSNLKGSIPIEIFLLSHLTVLDLEGNQLDGAVPSQVGDLHATLTFLDLRNNMLTGRLPSTLGLLTAATGLNFRGNSIGGTIPSELAQLSQLQGLWLDNTDLAGAVPLELCEMTSWTVGIWVECDSVDCSCPNSNVCECA